MEVDPAAVKGNPRALPTMSPAPARFCPRSRPCSLSVCRGMRLAAHPASSRAHSCACPCQPERDPAVADQFLKGETMTVHQVKAAASELQPQQEVEQLQLAVGRLHLVHCPLEVLVCHSRVPVQEEGGEEEEALEGEGDNLCPARQGQQASGQRPGGRPLGETPSWSSRPSAWTETTAETRT